MTSSYSVMMACTAPLVREQRANEGAQYFASKPGIPGAAITERVRQREDPLAHRDMRKHVVDEPGGCVRHSPNATGRAEPSTLAGAPDESTVPTYVFVHEA